MVDVEGKREDNSQGGDNTLGHAGDSDGPMSVERFDDTVAILTLTATVITIALGFIFNL